jgi:site-specific recombinase XerD
MPKRHVFYSQTHEKMTISCVEGIFKKYVYLARTEHPTLFASESYTPHSMRHTTASHMLEAGVPLVVIKNFLGHASLASTSVYAEITQNTVDRHVREWNEKWFPRDAVDDDPEIDDGGMPDFLK